jgi:hypothetical protein
VEKFRLGRKRIWDTCLAATYKNIVINFLATKNTMDFTVFGVFEFESWAQSPTPRDKTQPSNLNPIILPSMILPNFDEAATPLWSTVETTVPPYSPCLCGFVRGPD